MTKRVMSQPAASGREPGRGATQSALLADVRRLVVVLPGAGHLVPYVAGPDVAASEKFTACG